MSEISVVVPIYNAGKKLHKCIRSLLNQSFEDFELLLVNDGSTDNSLNICRKYQQQDSRIIVIDKVNEGSILTRKRGIESATSNYVMFVDADDWIDARMIEVLYNESSKDGIDVTVCNMYKVLGNGFIKKKHASTYFQKDRIFNQEEVKRDLVKAYFFGHPFPTSLCAKLYKRELLLNNGKYLERISFLGDDLFYNLEIFLKVKKVKIINQSLYYYRVGGFTSKFMPSLFDDMVNGYQIQKEVINQYYSAAQQELYNGISIMLLNTLKTCLCNLFNGKLNESEVKDLINSYIDNESIIECLDNNGAVRYFSIEYLDAVKDKDIEFLYQLGKSIYDSNRPKQALIHIASKFSFL